jgi:dolichol-phosphate mannosyltransferase
VGSLSAAEDPGANAVESLSIILAAYCEGENLSRLLPRVRRAAQGLTPKHEILVVDTLAPMDDTEAVCAANQVRLLRRQPSNDYGDAIRTGVRASQGDFVLTMDADGSHSPEFMRELWDQRHRADVVIASRYVAGGRTENPLLLVGMSRLLNRFFRAVVKFPVLDVSNSFRLYRGERLRSLSLGYRHFDVLEEVLARLLWHAEKPATVLEIPYRFERRIAGKSKRNLLMFSVHFMGAAIRLYGIRRHLEGRSEHEQDPQLP